MKKIAAFEISYLQYLNEHSEPTQAFPAFATDEALLKFYKQMTLLRVFDYKMVNLHRIGKIGTFPSSLGQEAIFVATGLAMQKEDILCPFYRDHGVAISRGYLFSDILAYWSGDERGNNSQFAKKDFPVCIPIAGQCLHATGVAYAIKYKKENKVVVANIGDGGTSKGDFYEAMNLAGIWNLPLVFIVDNNQWAISVPVTKQTAAETLAQKGIAAGIDCIQVDGNDVIAVFEAVQNAITQSRQGGKPTVIEAISFRLADHTTVDDATRYTKEEVKKDAWKKEPIARLGYYLEEKKLWSREKEAELQEECKQAVEQAFEKYFLIKKQTPESMFDFLFETLPDSLIDQRNDLVSEFTAHSKEK